jgi:hypothetical protein
MAQSVLGLLVLVKHVPHDSPRTNEEADGGYANIRISNPQASRSSTGATCLAQPV